MCFENSKITSTTVQWEKDLNFPEDDSALKAGIYFKMYLGLESFIPSTQAGLRYSGNDLWPQNTCKSRVSQFSVAITGRCYLLICHDLALTNGENQGTAEIYTRNVKIGLEKSMNENMHV